MYVPMVPEHASFIGLITMDRNCQFICLPLPKDSSIKTGTLKYITVSLPNA